MQVARESAISCKWTIISLAIATASFFNYLASGSGYLWDNLFQMMQKPGPIFFAIISISFFNGTMQGIVMLIGSMIDKNEYHVYHLVKESSVFTYAYADIIVMGVIVFMLVFCLKAVFAILTLLFKKIFGSINLNKKVLMIINVILVIASLGLAFISVTCTFSLTLPILYLLLFVKLSLSSTSMSLKSFSNVSNLLFPLTLSLALHLDTYLIDAWRLHHLPQSLLTSYHYQDSQLSQSKFAHLIYTLTTLFLSNDIALMTDAYGRYGKHTQLLVGLFGMVACGHAVYRIKTVMGMALIVQSVILIAYVAGAKKNQKKAVEEVTKK